MMKINTALVISILLMAGPAFAKPDISIILNAKKLVEKQGKKNFEEVKKASPGDVLVYTLKVWNKGDSPAFKLQPIGDIPATTVYIPEKYESKDYKVVFSIDKGKTFNESPTIKVVEKGKLVEKKAPIEMYNKIKWIFSKTFEPKKTVELNYKVKVK